MSKPTLETCAGLYQAALKVGQDAVDVSLDSARRHGYTLAQIKAFMSETTPSTLPTTQQVEQFVADLKAFAALAHANSRAKGFWSIADEIKNHPRAAELETIWKLSRQALIMSETAEGIEGIRKNLPDDHLPQFSMEVTELADTVIRILDYCGAYNLPLGEAIVAKMLYNTKRPHMHGKNS